MGKLFNRSSDNKNKRSFFDISDGNYDGADSYGFIKEEQTPQNRSIKRRKILSMVFAIVLGACLFGVIASLMFRFTTSLCEKGDDPKPVNVRPVTPTGSTNPGQGDTPLDPESFQALESAYAGVRAAAVRFNRCVAEVSAMNYTEDPVFTKKLAETREFFGVVFGNNGTDYLILVRNDSLDKPFQELNVNFNGGTVGEARVIARNSEVNIAVLAVSARDFSDYDKSGIGVVTCGDSGQCKMGSTLIALGCVNGHSLSENVGFITSERVTVYIRDDSLQLVETNMIRYDDAFGVVVNSSGEVVGIINDTFGKSNCLSFLAINSLSDLLDDMLNNHKTPVFGAMMSDISSFSRQKLGIKGGVLIEEVFKGTPADEAGLRKGDIILEAADETMFYVDQFNTKIRKNPDDEKLRIVYMRNGETYTIEVRLSYE